MTSPELSAIKERGAQYQFHIELLDRSGLYRALDHNGQMDNDGFQPTLEIGSLRSKSGLFSQITVQANMLQDGYLLRGGYDITATLRYRNKANQCWSKDQVDQMRELLESGYQDAAIESMTSKSNNSLIIIGPMSKLFYVIDLGYKNEKTAYENQVEKESNKLLDGEALREFMTARLPARVDSSITIKPMDKDLNTDYSNARFITPIIGRLINNTQAVREFTETTQNWAWRVQDFVNAMSKVKGIPQSGKLTLLPPQDLPKFKK